MKKQAPSDLFVPARAPSHRQLRVAEEVRHVLSSVLTRGDLPEPGLADQPITITRVQISPDLQYADVFVMPLGGKNKDEILELLKLSAGPLRQHLSKRLHLKIAPRIRFYLDRSLEHAERIEILLRSDKETPDDPDSE